MADPLGGDQFDVEGLAEAEIEKLLKQVRITIFYPIFSIKDRVCYGLKRRKIC